MVKKHPVKKNYNRFVVFINIVSAQSNFFYFIILIIFIIIVIMHIKRNKNSNRKCNVVEFV